MQGIQLARWLGRAEIMTNFSRNFASNLIDGRWIWKQLYFGVWIGSKTSLLRQFSSNAATRIIQTGKSVLAVEARKLPDLPVSDKIRIESLTDLIRRVVERERCFRGERQ